VATEVVMPQMGYDMQEGKVLRWLKQEGEQVARSEIIAEIETDKAAIEMPAYAEGVLGKIYIQEGMTVPVGTVIAVITAPGEEIPDAPPADAPAATPSEVPAPALETAPAPPVVTPVAAAVPATGQIKASPVARRLADELGVSLSQITGTGPGGRITKTDVQGFSASTPAPATPAPAAEKTKEEAAAPPRLTIDQVPETIQLSPMRRAIARVTSASNRDVPHFYVMGEIEMDGVMELRSQVNRDLQEQEGLRLSVNDFIIKASARALAKFPNLNAFFEGDSLKMNKTINVGVAMDLKGQGLMIPALMDVGSMSLVEISKAVRHLAERARSGHLTQEEYTAGTFTVSNLGMFNVDNFVAIIFPPQAAVLATGSVKKRPVVRDDQIVVGQVMNCTLSIDHRISDGAEAAQFMGELKRLLESPALLLM